jgi:hypothetical protein
MKKIILFLVLVNFSLESKSQSDTVFIPQYVFGGSIFMQIEQRKEYYSYKITETYYQISPLFGIYIHKNMILGTNPSLTKLRYLTEYEGWFTEHKMSIPIFLRYQNKLWMNTKYYIDLQVGNVVNFESGKTLENFGKINLGAMYFIRDRLSIELSVLSMNFVSKEQKYSKNKQYYFDIQYDVAYPNFGFKYYF